MDAARIDRASSLRLPPLRGSVGMPLWLQLKHALRDVATFTLQDGERIPTEVEIGEHYGVSRVTVRQAVTSLVDEGLLHRQQGRGTFVLKAAHPDKHPRPEHFLTNGLDAAPREHVRVYSSEVMEAPGWLADKLDLRAGADVFKIRKMLQSGPEPDAFRTTFVPVAVAPDLLDHDLAEPIHRLMERRYDLRPASADEFMEFIKADEFRSSMLGIALEDPLILVERIVFLDTGRAVQCARTYYRADRFRIEHRFTR